MNAISKTTAAAATMFCLTLTVPPAAAQRMAAFIHGFSFADDSGATLSEKGARWLESGTPAEWVARDVIDGYVLLNYYNDDLYTNTNGVMAGFANQMRSHPNSEWLLVGHSQGGIVARLLAEYARTTATDVDVNGVLTFASPMQGARPTLVSYGNHPGYRDISAEVDEYVEDLIVGPLGDLIDNFVTGQPFFDVDAEYKIATNFWDPAGSTAEVIVNALELENRINSIAVEESAKDFIGPDGSLISAINSAPTHANSRAIVASERYPALARMASTAPTSSADVALYLNIFGNLPRLVGATPEAPIFLTRSQEIDPGDEAAAIGFYDFLRSTYGIIEFYYESQEGPFDVNCFVPFSVKYGWFFYETTPYNPCTRSSRWARGRSALDGADDLRLNLIDSFKLELQYIYVQVQVCEPGPGGDPKVEWLGPVDYAMRVCDPGEDPYDYVGQWTWVTVPEEQTDGLLGVSYQVWSDGDDPDDNSRNFLYGASGADSGYNHGEIVYMRRRYDSSSDTYHAGTAFSLGDLNISVSEVETWIATNVFPPGN